MIFLQGNKSDKNKILDTVFSIHVSICYLRGFDSKLCLVIEPEESRSIRHPELVGKQPPIDAIRQMLSDALETIDGLKAQQS